MLEYVVLALTLPATTYGWGEGKCGDPKAPMQCVSGMLTASGEMLNAEPAAALPLPAKRRMRTMYLSLRAQDGQCIQVKVNDKSHERWIGKRGLDVNREALLRLVRNPHDKWSGKLEGC